MKSPFALFLLSAFCHCQQQCSNRAWIEEVCSSHGSFSQPCLSAKQAHELRCTRHGAEQAGSRDPKGNMRDRSQRFDSNCPAPEQVNEVCLTYGSLSEKCRRIRSAHSACKLDTHWDGGAGGARGAPGNDGGGSAGGTRDEHKEGGSRQDGSEMTTWLRSIWTSSWAIGLQRLQWIFVQEAISFEILSDLGHDELKEIGIAAFGVL